jgi:hypothetical protein
MDDPYDPFVGAQQAAELRLAACYAVMYEDQGEEEEDLSEEVRLERNALLGPFCGCECCIVREILDAARLHLLGTITPEDLARNQGREYPSKG